MRDHLLDGTNGNNLVSSGEIVEEARVKEGREQGLARLLRERFILTMTRSWTRSWPGWSSSVLECLSGGSLNFSWFGAQKPGGGVLLRRLP